MNTRGMLNWFFSPSFDYYNISQYDKMIVANMICNEATRQYKIISGEDCQHVHVPKIDVKLYEKSDFLRPVIEINSILDNVSSELIGCFLIHGSLADLKYIKGWSDLDTWVVIKDEIFKNPVLLVEAQELFFKLNKFLLKIDPIAHHGFIMVLESDLNNYDDFLLPPEVIGNGINLYGSTEIYIRRNNIRYDWAKKFQNIKNIFIEFDLLGVFKHHSYRGKYLTKDMVRQNDGMYQFKYLIGLVMMLPSMYCSAIGKPVYKLKSFELFPISSPIIECFSAIRESWEIMEKYPYVPNSIPNWLMDMVPADYISQIIKLLDDILNNLDLS